MLWCLTYDTNSYAVQYTQLDYLSIAEQEQEIVLQKTERAT